MLRRGLETVSNALVGRRLHILTIDEDLTREALAMVVDTSIGSLRMAPS